MALDANMQIRIEKKKISPPIFIVIFDPCRGQIEIFEAQGVKFHVFLHHNIEKIFYSMLNWVM